MMNAVETGKIIATLRKKMKMTQQELAEHLHVSSSAVSKWERGLNFPDLLLLEPLSEILETTPTRLLCLENETADAVFDKITEIQKQEIQIKKAAQKTKIHYLVSTLIVFIGISTLYLFLGRDTPENNALLQKSSVSILTLLPLCCGICSWGLGFISLFLCHNSEQSKKYAILSLGLCAIAVFFVVMIFDYLLRFENYALLDDVAWAYHFGSMGLISGSIIINLFSWIASLKIKSKKN